MNGLYNYLCQLFDLTKWLINFVLNQSLNWNN